MFEDMVNYIEPCKKGNVEIKVNDLSNEKFWCIFNATPPKKYIGLYVNGSMMMSDTYMERRSNMCIERLQGDVLIAGLGIGMILVPLLKNQNVKSITVIEKSKDVIDLIEPQIKKLDKNGILNIIHADAYEYVPSEKFDSIYLDIWPSYNSDIYEEEMKPLKKRYRQYLNKANPNKYIGVWAWENARRDRPLR